MLGKAVGMFMILKEAAEIAPVPFLKGAISTTLVLLQTARVSCAIAAFELWGYKLIEPPFRRLDQTVRICYG
jgi:hypothetical protein